MSKTPGVAATGPRAVRALCLVPVRIGAAALTPSYLVLRWPLGLSTARRHFFPVPRDGIAMQRVRP